MKQMEVWLNNEFSDIYFHTHSQRYYLIVITGENSPLGMQIGCMEGRFENEDMHL